MSNEQIIDWIVINAKDYTSSAAEKQLGISSDKLKRMAFGIGLKFKNVRSHHEFECVKCGHIYVAYKDSYNQICNSCIIEWLKLNGKTKTLKQITSELNISYGRLKGIFLAHQLPYLNAGTSVTKTCIKCGKEFTFVFVTNMRSHCGACDKKYIPRDGKPKIHKDLKLKNGIHVRDDAFGQFMRFGLNGHN